MKILYFAWLRERTGCTEEEIPLPEGVKTVGQLVDWQIGRGGGFAQAFADRSTIRVAVNMDYADTDTPVGDGDEVAFFPPVTGG